MLVLRHNNGNFSTLTVSQLLAWLDRNPGVSIVTDIKTDNISGLRRIKAAAGKRLPRFIPQIYQPAPIEEAKGLDFDRIIFAERVGESTGRYPWVNQADLWAMTIPKEMASLAPTIRQPVFLYTVNQRTDKDVGLYTDCLIPDRT